MPVVPHEVAPWSEHAVWQQMLPVHALLRHSASVVQAAPSGRRAQVVPWQRPLVQSFDPPQVLPVPQVLFNASHCGPPQSVSVSLPSFRPSAQDTHVPGLVPKQNEFAQSEFAAQCF
jgi:hypothetical protein